MPAKSGKQYRFMQAAASGRLRSIGDHIKKGVAKEFIKETPPNKRKAFSKKKTNAE